MLQKSLCGVGICCWSACEFWSGLGRGFGRGPGRNRGPMMHGHGQGGSAAVAASLADLKLYSGLGFEA